jgi:putative membrane protein insertion efficiency factor
VTGEPHPRRAGPVAKVLLLLLHVYRAGISPLLGPRCRFAPSCSAYAVEAVTLHGAAWGGLLSARRVLRCHPLHPGGHDPVPPPAPPGARRHGSRHLRRRTPPLDRPAAPTTPDLL